MLHGAVDVHLLCGPYDLTGDTMTLEDEVEQTLEEHRPFKGQWDRHKPVGTGRGRLEAGGGLYDDRVAGMLAAWQAQGQSKQLVAWGMEGDEPGADITIVEGTFANTFKRVGSAAGLTKGNAVYTLSGFIRRARLHHGLTTRTADGNSQSTSLDQHTARRVRAQAVTSSSVANPTVITTPLPHGLATGDVVVFTAHASVTPDINGGSGYAVTVTGETTFTIPVNVSDGGVGGTFKKVTSTGGVMRLHVPALTLGGHTNAVIRLLHSDDDITFTAKATFDAVTAMLNTRAQQHTIAGQIKRFTAIDWDFTGAGSGPSMVPYVAVARNR